MTYILHYGSYPACHLTFCMNPSWQIYQLISIRTWQTFNKNGKNDVIDQFRLITSHHPPAGRGAKRPSPFRPPIQSNPVVSMAPHCLKKWASGKFSRLIPEQKKMNTIAWSQIQRPTSLVALHCLLVFLRFEPFPPKCTLRSCEKVIQYSKNNPCFRHIGVCVCAIKSI